MVTMPSYPAYPSQVYKSKDLVPKGSVSSQKVEVSWASLEEFLRSRSLQRILYFAGGAGVFFAAWYLYQRLCVEDDAPLPRTTESILSTGIVPKEARVIIEEAGDNKAVKVPVMDGGDKTSLVKTPAEKKVIIHCCPRGFYVPSIATEPLKLETFLRVTNIPYEVNFCNEFETPLLTYGEKVGNDFRECVKILSEKFDVNLEDSEVSASRKTASHLVDISLENHFSWAILIWRWIFDEGKSMNKIHAMNALGEEVVPEVSQKVKNAIKFQPIGQMEKGEFVKTINQGIHDISAALGRHKYFQGQTPGTVDCHAFAILVQVMWNMPGSPFETHLKKYGNLVDYIKRMKEKYWPDWNELILKPKEFDENYNAILKHHQRSSSSSSKTRKSSNERSEKDKNFIETPIGSEDESGHRKSGAMKVASPNDLHHGILKQQPDSLATNTGNTNLTVNSVQSSKNKQPVSPLAPSPKEREQQQKVISKQRQESVMHVHKPSVKFATAASAESTASAPPPTSSISPQPAPANQQTQHPQNQPSEVNSNNGNFHHHHSTVTSQIPVRTQYPSSAAELSSKRPNEEQHQAEQLRHSMLAQGQYANYLQQQQQQQQKQQLQQQPQHNPSLSPQYFQQASQVPYTQGQPSYHHPTAPQVFNSQSVHGNAPPYSHHHHQVLYGHGGPQQTTDNMGSLIPISHQQAQAHLEAYYPHQQYQPSQYNTGSTSNYHTQAEIAPSFVTPPFDPRNPAASLLRY